MNLKDKSRISVLKSVKNHVFENIINLYSDTNDTVYKYSYFDIRNNVRGNVGDAVRSPIGISVCNSINNKLNGYEFI